MAPSILAYIDPGSGSILLQLLIGSILGGGIFFRDRICRLLGVFRPDNTAAAPPDPARESPGE